MYYVKKVIILIWLKMANFEERWQTWTGCMPPPPPPPIPALPTTFPTEEFLMNGTPPPPPPPSANRFNGGQLGAGLPADVYWSNQNSWWIIFEKSPHPPRTPLQLRGYRLWGGILYSIPPTHPPPTQGVPSVGGGGVLTEHRKDKETKS
jgi:hypothetical protein